MTGESDPSDFFEGLVGRVGPAMLSYARRRVDSGTAEDVVAEALVVLWRRRDKLPVSTAVVAEGDGSNEVAWAIGITRHCLANAHRSARRRELLARQLAGLERHRPSAAVAVADESEAIRCALDSLRSSDRELLRLWAWDDLKPAQIAVVLNTTPAVVSVRLHRAKKRLSDALTEAAELREAALPRPTTPTL